MQRVACGKTSGLAIPNNKGDGISLEKENINVETPQKALVGRERAGTS